MIRHHLWPFWAKWINNYLARVELFANITNNLSNSDLIIQNHFLCFAMFSSGFDIAWRPGQVSLFASFRTSSIRLYHNWNSVMLMARIHDAKRYCNRRKQWAKPTHFTKLFFSILALLSHPLCSNVIALAHDCVKSHQYLLSYIHMTLFFAQNLAFFEQSSLPNV